MPTREDILHKAAASLARAGIATASLDARLLLQHVLGLSHASLIADANVMITDQEANEFYELLLRRQGREPISRILGKREFYGLEFWLNHATLDPRPDTETLVEEALRFKPEKILDLGTGTGAIIISLLANLPNAVAIATDLAPKALEMAARNALAHGVADRLKLIQSDWFAEIDDQFDMIVSNPPYIPEAEITTLEPEVVNNDPHLALSGGVDGLVAYRKIIHAAPAALKPGGRLILEIGKGQETAILGLLAAAGFAGMQQLTDLSGIIRVISAQKPE